TTTMLGDTTKSRGSTNNRKRTGTGSYGTPTIGCGKQIPTASCRCLAAASSPAPIPTGTARTVTGRKIRWEKTRKIPLKKSGKQNDALIENQIYKTKTTVT